MSMLTGQVDRLRDRAKELGDSGNWGNDGDAALMELAADTIESLRERLQDAALRSGECEMVDRWEYEDEDGYIWPDCWECTSCGAMVSGILLAPDREVAPRFCPNCRSEVKAVRR